MRKIVFFFVLILVIPGCNITENITHAPCDITGKGSITIVAPNATYFDWHFAPFFSPVPNFSSTFVTNNQNITSARPGQYFVEIGKPDDQGNIKMVESRNYEVFHHANLNLSNIVYNSGTESYTYTSNATNLGTAITTLPLLAQQSVFYDFDVDRLDNFPLFMMGINNTSTVNLTGYFKAPLSFAYIGLSFNGYYSEWITYNETATQGSSKHVKPEDLQTGYLARKYIHVRLTARYLSATNQYNISYTLNGNTVLNNIIINSPCPSYFSFVMNENVRIKNFYTSNPCFSLNYLNYATMTKSLDGAIYTFANGSVKVKYNVPYNITSQDFIIQEIGSTSLPIAISRTVTMGENYLSLPFSGTGAAGAVYLITATDPKGETFKLKFKQQ